VRTAQEEREGVNDNAPGPVIATLATGFCVTAAMVQRLIDTGVVRPIQGDHLTAEGV
jgi:hypothetical protein